MANSYPDVVTKSVFARAIYGDQVDCANLSVQISNLRRLVKPYGFDIRTKRKGQKYEGERRLEKIS